MTTISNGESGLSVRNKLNNVLQHADGSASEFVINDAGADVNLRVESDTNTHALFVDGGTGKVGIGTSIPQAELQVLDALKVSSANQSSGSVILGDGGSTAFNVGIARWNGATNAAGAGGVGYFAQGAGNVGGHFFYTGDAAAGSTTERVRIDSSGNVFINSTTFPVVGIEKFGVNGSTTIAGAFGNNSSTNASIFVSNGYNGGSKLVQFAAYQGQQCGSITTNGSSSTSYNTSSDYRLKENVVPLSGAADRLAQIPVHRFNFIADPDRTVDGFLAHEVQEFVPECVTGDKDQVDDEGNPVYQGIDQSKLVPLLTAALQEALTEIASLKARLDAANL